MRIERTEGLISYLESPKKIVITNHINPDGDAMGSALSLNAYFNKMGHQTQVIVPNGYPEFLSWLPGNEQVIVFENDSEKASGLFEAADLIVCLDYNAVNRSGEIQPLLESATCPILMIDHHQQPQEFSKWMISDTSKCSTAQMVYEFIAFMGGLELMDVGMANCIYTGILTDTGSFRFSSTTSQTHKIVAHLLDLGVQPDQVYGEIFDSNSVSRLRLLGTTLEQMKLYPQQKGVILYLNESQLLSNNFKKGDSEGFVNYGLSIEGMSFSAFLREDKEKIKISFRSKGTIDVNVLARKYINGGGHMNAAGGVLEMSIDQAIAHVEKMIITELS